MKGMRAPVLPLRLFLAACLGHSAVVSGQILKLTDPQEIEVGRRAAAEVELDQPLFRDPRTGDYVQKIGLRLARESQRPGLRFSFKILQSDDVNAFALPGGFVYLTRGLVEFVQREDELAAALAHEIGHIAARQHASKIRRSQFASLGVTFLGPAAGGGLRVAAAMRGARSGARGLFMRFTAEDEREADRIGTKILHDAGYDPSSMHRLLQRLAGLQEADAGLVASYYRSHSRVDDRADSLADLIAMLPPANRRDRGNELARIQEHIQAVKPKGAATSSAAAAAVLEADGEELPSLDARDREVAALFAPIFYQTLGNEPRFDYITNFDFDGDWRGDNNWDNAAKQEFPLKAWVYYAVRETRSHFFLHYAAFHPRDYKGGMGRGRLVSKAIRTATKPAAAIDPTGRVAEAVLAHENDLEGCLLVVEKHGDDPKAGKVVFLQTLAHNNFLKYVPEDQPREGFPTFITEGRRVKLFIEPKGHGIEAFQPASAQAKNRLRPYTFTGHAETPTADLSTPVGYDLTPIATTFWIEAQRGITPTFAEVSDHGLVLIDMLRGDRVEETTWRIGGIGSAFRGSVGGRNLARPPWAWFDGKDKAQPMGQWFFDPARAVRRDYALDDSFSTAYLRPWPNPAADDAPPEP